jgi:hypothetical protein
MKKYEDLTPEEKELICNGCGGKGGFVKPPHALFFAASCNHHDYGYWKGCVESDREDCDLKFYEAMIEDCKTLNWFEWLRYRPWAYFYYKAVRMFGDKYFHYAYEKRSL